MTTALRGAIAASLTPLGAGGGELDLGAVPDLVTFLAGGGVDGALVAGTTGEGVLLTTDERRALAAAFVDAAPEGFRIAVHAGAQSTRDTVELSAHARDLGVAAVAVIAPPYFPLDDDELVRHLAEAAAAAEPVPFYVYEFAARSGYAIAPGVVRRLGERASNLVGMKVSDTPFDAVRPYLDLGLDVFVGSEPLALEGLGAGAIGTVSGLGAAFPEIVAELVHERSPSADDRVRALREALGGVPFHAALKAVLGARGVPVGPDVRPPLRDLTDGERDRVLAVAREVGALD
jgi:dihydrodipicolinate synthase/N-acetylneuraminate lyase